MRSTLVPGRVGAWPTRSSPAAEKRITLPAMIGRLGIGGADTLTGVLSRPAEPNSRLYHLRRFYYDTAMSTNVVQMQALKTIAGVSQIVFGTDYPFGGDAARHLTGLQSCGLSAEELRSIQRENAAKFLTKYASPAPI